MALEPLILVADDDDDICLLVTRQLEGAGYRVVAARNGYDALQLAVEHEPDLLLLDVSMPVLGGHDLCRAVTDNNLSPPPVIFLSARTLPSDRVLGLEAGAVDYLTKPFDQRELLARVGVALRTRRQLTELAHDAAIDRMTGLHNRAQLDDRLSEAVARARRYGTTLGCVLLDLDHFKSINDHFGHLTGDEVLREIAARLRRKVRADDTVFRYGGEEFCVLVQGGEEAGVMILAGALVEAIGREPIAGLDVTASAGVAVWTASFAEPADLLGAADAALYAAKRGGRAHARLSAA